MSNYEIINKNGKTIGEVVSHDHYMNLYGLILIYSPNEKLHGEDLIGDTLLKIDKALHLVKSRIEEQQQKLEDTVVRLEKHKEVLSGVKNEQTNA